MAEERAERARAAAAAIRTAGGYRWVGIYEVGPSEIAAIAWDGEGAPAHPVFPVDQGLCGAAVAGGETVVVGDVTADPRYLTTFGSTRSEMIVPVRVGSPRTVRGLIDVESERVDAFGDDDLRLVNGYAEELVPLFDSGAE
jgi:L-methionine (R)-S-oxide reductase